MMYQGEIKTGTKEKAENMSKLVNISVHEAKNVICGWVEGDKDNEDGDFWGGIALDSAARWFMIPKLIVVGVFDDGTTKAGGLHSWQDFNYEKDLFLYNNIVGFITLDAAKALVRGGLDSGEYNDHKKARKGIYESLKASGVVISEEAKLYLLF